MVEKGIRYIVTTTDCVYVTPSINVNKERNEVSILEMSVLGEPSTKVFSIDSVVALVKETYEQENILDTLISPCGDKKVLISV